MDTVGEIKAAMASNPEVIKDILRSLEPRTRKMWVLLAEQTIEDFTKDYNLIPNLQKLINFCNTLD